MLTPEDWKRVKTIAGDAWARRAAERLSYIAQACAGDEALHREVSSLLAAMVSAEEQFEVPPEPPLDDLVVLGSLEGRRVGPYTIISRIGAGGMGELYKARDTRLDRVVAIKLLPSRESADAAARARMEREARAVAVLNHPHICTLHDIGHEDGLDFLVMEYLEGETLAARLSRGPLPIAQALQYADQIASALAEAHRAGIVHHDVKPANIMLERAGAPLHAKLLDFGIARAGPSEIPSAPRPPLRDAAPDLTLPGSVLGTAHYMAPEQLEGRPADARADIFAFGAVLFEMLTGRKAFGGSRRADVLAAIRETDAPRVSSLRAVPAALDRIVGKCLARDANGRYQSVQQLMAELRAARRGLESPSPARILTRTLAVAGLVAGSVATWAVWRGGVGPAPPPSVTRLAASAGVLGAPALSPDGSSVVFTWVGDSASSPELVLLRIGSTTRVRLTNDPGVEEWPAWSPDGTRIAFVRCGNGRCGIFTLPVGGGAERRLRDLRDDRYNGLAWSPDGRSIAYAERASPSEPYALFLLATDTLVPHRLSTPPPGMGVLRFAFSPDGRSLALIRIDEAIGVHLVNVADGAVTTLVSGQHEWFGGVAWSADGRSLILSANQEGVRHLWKLPVAGGGLEQLAVAGENAYHPSVSARGERLAFVHELRDWDLSRAPLDSAGHTRSSAPLASSPRIDLDPAFSPDGRQLAFVSERGGSREVWASNADGTDARQLTSLRGQGAGGPSWSPDGRFLAFHARGIYIMPAGGGPPRKVSDDGEMPSWSADGRWIYFRRNVGGRVHIWKVAAAGGPAVQAVTSEALSAQEEPQGADLYFAVRDGIWRQPLSGGQETPVIEDFKWSLAGYWTVVSDGIYYVAAGTHSDASVTNPVRFFEFATRRTLDVGTLTGSIEDWVGGMTVSPDRRTVVYSHRTYKSSEIVVIDNFR